ncbi:hypothetical protein AAIE21_10905 [Paenibacillus sp. 102]|uniref:hypothetical protein n=1 Tax=Paenibacillus sp. 102 TaxID=3120823 RepID=UPI0031BB90B3
MTKERLTPEQTVITVDVPPYTAYIIKFFSSSDEITGTFTFNNLTSDYHAQDCPVTPGSASYEITKNPLIN